MSLNRPTTRQERRPGSSNKERAPRPSNFSSTAQTQHLLSSPRAVHQQQQHHHHSAESDEVVHQQQEEVKGNNTYREDKRKRKRDDAVNKQVTSPTSTEQLLQIPVEEKKTSASKPKPKNKDVGTVSELLEMDNARRESEKRGNLPSAPPLTRIFLDPRNNASAAAASTVSTSAPTSAPASNRRK